MGGGAQRALRALAPVMEEAWRNAGKLRKAVHEIYKAEHDAFEACLALSKAEGQNSGRSDEGQKNTNKKRRRRTGKK